MPYWFSVKLCPSIPTEISAIVDGRSQNRTFEIIIIVIKYFSCACDVFLITVLSVRVHFASYLYIMNPINAQKVERIKIAVLCTLHSAMKEKSSII
jgi:hypothetical protein